MKLKFTPYDPATHYEAGSLTITAETPEQVEELGNAHRLDLATLAPAFVAGRLELTLPHRFFRIESCLDQEFLDPYISALEKLTGQEPGSSRLRTVKMDLIPPGIFKSEYFHGPAFIEDGCFCFDVIFRDFHKETEKDEQERFNYAHRAAQERMKEILGVRPVIPEFIQAGNNAMVRNPDWGTGKRLPVKPGVHCQELWQILFNWWLANEATDQQRAAVAACDKGNCYLSYSGSRDGGWYPESRLYILCKNGDIPWSKGEMARVIKSFSETEIATCQL